MRAIKKIVALATGATMVGATIMGAMAADLADYPAPYVDGCTFSGAIVVGESAAAEDVVGAVDVASALAVSGTTTAGSGGTTVTASGESVKIETSNKKLTFGASRHNISDIKTSDIDEDDLPTILADGVYKADDSAEYEYEQKIRFNDHIGMDFKEDTDYNDKENVIRVYVNRNTNLLNYTLDFTKDVEADLSAATITDMDDTTIEMLGNTYDITTAENSSATNVKFVLMGGAIRDILEQGQSKTYTLNDKEYEVEVTYINNLNAKLKINGEVTDLMTNDNTYKTDDGTTLGIREVMEEEAGEVDADKVEFYLGAEKLTLQDTTANVQDKKDNVEMDDTDIDDLYVDIVATGTSDKIQIDKIILSWYPDDELFITEDSEAIFPGLESFKLNYEGFTAPAEEEILVQNNGDQELELTVPIKSGKATIPLLALNGTGAAAVFNRVGGEAADEGLVTATGTRISYDRDEDEYFVASDTSAEETYLLQVTKVDDSDGADFKDVVSGTKYENKKNNTAFSVGEVSLTVQWIAEGNNSVVVSGSGTTSFNRVYTEEGLLIYLPVNNTDGTVAHPEIATNGTTTSWVLQMTEEDRNDDSAQGLDVNVTLGVTSGTTSRKTQVSSIATRTSNFVNKDYYEIGDTDEFEGYVQSDLGTHVFYDTDPDQNTAKIIYHGGESYGNVFVSAIETGFGTSEGGEVVCKVAVPPAMLDSEVADVNAQNWIGVGGPCANSAVAAAMGVAGTIPECLEGFEEGKAMIKLYDLTGGNVAMVVAGATALDTRRASRVLANYEDYALSGAEVEVTGTSLSDIAVSKVGDAMMS